MVDFDWASFFNAVKDIALVVIGGYWAYKKLVAEKNIESTTQISVAEIQNKDDVTKANTELQITYAQAYQLLTDEAKKSIEESAKRSAQTEEEMRQLREYVNRLEQRVIELEESEKRKQKQLAEAEQQIADARKQISDLQATDKQKDKKINLLQQRLARIKGELDTGSLKIESQG